MSTATAVHEGKYIYCIIGSSEPRSFGPLGIGGRGDSLHTIVDGRYRRGRQRRPADEVSGVA